MREVVSSQVALVDLVPVVVLVDVLDCVGDSVVRMPLLVACAKKTPAIMNRRKRFMSPYTMCIELLFRSARTDPSRHYIHNHKAASLFPSVVSRHPSATSHILGVFGDQPS